MTRDVEVSDSNHGYSVSLPDTTPTGQVVTIQQGERGGIHIMHAESPDLSELYFEVTTYPRPMEHDQLAEEQQQFLRARSSDRQLTAAHEGDVGGYLGTTFDFRGTLQGRWKERRFLFVDASRRTYRVVFDPTSALNLRVLGNLKFHACNGD